MKWCLLERERELITTLDSFLILSAIFGMFSYFVLKLCTTCDKREIEKYKRIKVFLIQQN